MRIDLSWRQAFTTPHGVLLTVTAAISNHFERTIRLDRARYYISTMTRSEMLDSITSVVSADSYPASMFLSWPHDVITQTISLSEYCGELESGEAFTLDVDLVLPKDTHIAKVSLSVIDADDGEYNWMSSTTYLKTDLY